MVLLLALAALAAAMSVQEGGTARDLSEPLEFDFKHHDNTELPDVLRAVHRRCPDITRLYTLSETSVRGTPLYVIEFSSSPHKWQPRKCIQHMDLAILLARETLHVMWVVAPGVKAHTRQSIGFTYRSAWVRGTRGGRRGKRGPALPRAPAQPPLERSRP